MGKLTTEKKIEELKKLLETQTDDALLDEIYDLLRPEKNSLLKQELTLAILKAEEDLENGDVYTTEEVIEMTNRLPGK